MRLVSLIRRTAEFNHACSDNCVFPEPNHVIVEFNQVSLIMRLVSLTMFGEFNHVR
jgi:hypothetical protein